MKHGSIRGLRAGALVVFNGNLGILLDTPDESHSQNSWHIRILTFRGIEKAVRDAYVGYVIDEP